LANDFRVRRAFNIAAVGNAGRRRVELTQIKRSHGIGVCNNPTRQYFPAHLCVPMKICLSQRTPLASFPLDAVYVDRTILAENPGNDAVKRIRHIGHKHGINVPPQHIHHACQRMGKSAKRFGLNAG
jgi:hypothetical protein